jgi:hypothetical protein
MAKKEIDPRKDSKAKIPHRERKNPGMRDKHQEERRVQNSVRGKQVYDLDTKTYSRRTP